jgi:hypothetical protein
LDAVQARRADRFYAGGANHRFRAVLRDELPVIPVPLKGDFADAKLDLKAHLDRVYDAAGYEDYLYESFPEPPLDQTDAMWAQAFITQ